MPCKSAVALLAATETPRGQLGKRQVQVHELRKHVAGYCPLSVCGFVLRDGEDHNASLSEGIKYHRRFLNADQPWQLGHFANRLSQLTAAQHCICGKRVWASGEYRPDDSQN